jgi:hypothetical protein
MLTNMCALQVIGRIMSRKEALSQFIQQIHGRPVVVKLNSGVDYRGKTFEIWTNGIFLRFYKLFVAC